MGFYIETPDRIGKGTQIRDLYGGEILDAPPATFKDIPVGKALICVVANAGFDAAAFCHDEREFREFTAPDHLVKGGTRETVKQGVHILEIGPEQQRPRTWLLIDWDKAVELTGYKP